MRRGSLVAIGLAVAALGVAACGDDDDDSGGDGGGDGAAQQGGGAYGTGGDRSETKEQAAGGGGGTIALAADPGGALKFDKDRLDAKAGSVTIAFDNPSSASAPHAVEVEGNGVEEESDTIDPGQKTELTVDLEPGEYTYYCPVGNHEQAGMTGTLTVK
jgi:plastocyanin